MGELFESPRAGTAVAGGSSIPLSTVTTAGDLIVGTGAGTVTRLPAGAAGTVLEGQGVGVSPAYAVLPGTLLATKKYAPVTIVAYGLAASLAALDTVNLTLPLTVPANGIVDIDVAMYCNLNPAATSGCLAFGLLNHTGGAQIGETVNVEAFQGAASINENLYARPTWHLTGLTPGALQLDLAAGINSTSSLGGVCYAMGYTGTPNNSGCGPAIMRASASV